ncbi:UNVERIFIED_CONTAM: hypothetical protein Slati_1352500 [Sesamum latifolium]|uniref:Uncharacterized protein n=1 Tax=Sesamum latifolium TaxID=2727402 RepID=A0AAW2XIL7_9LAMI
MAIQCIGPKIRTASGLFNKIGPPLVGIRSSVLLNQLEGIRGKLTAWSRANADLVLSRIPTLEEELLKLLKDLFLQKLADGASV